MSKIILFNYDDNFTQINIYFITKYKFLIKIGQYVN